MVKITIEGKEVPRIVIYPEVPQPVELIEQRNGQRVTAETCRALEFGRVDPAGEGEAAELLRWLWEHAGDHLVKSDGAKVSSGGRWNGWQAAAWVATNDLAVATRLASPIEFKVSDGGRRMLHGGTDEACLRWEIATKHCRCGADGDGLCTCLDEGFGKLNIALRSGKLIELGQQSLGPVNRENARGMLFASRSVQTVFPTIDLPREQGRPTGTGKDDNTALQGMAKLIEGGKVKTINAAARAAAAGVSAHSSNSQVESIVRRLADKYRKAAAAGEVPLPKKPQKDAAPMLEK